MYTTVLIHEGMPEWVLNLMAYGKEGNHVWMRDIIVQILHIITSYCHTIQLGQYIYITI